MDEDELKQILLELFKTSRTVQARLNLMFLEEEYGKTILEKYKKRLLKIFNSRQGFSLEKAKAVLSEFEEICGQTKWYGQLALYYACLATEMTLSCGGMGQRFYAVLADAYHDAVEVVYEDEDLYHQWRKSLEFVLNVFLDFGWGMDDYIVNEYYSIPWVEEE